MSKNMMPMVSVTRLTRTKGESGGILAFADVVIGKHFSVRGIRVMKTDKGEWVSMPGRKTEEGKFIETFYPATKEGREVLHSVVKAAYKLSQWGRTGARA